MSDKKTIGQAIDEIITALSSINETDRDVALQAACTHLSLKFPSLASVIPLTASKPAMQQATEHVKVSVEANTPHVTQAKDIRSLKDEKQPTSAREMACIVAFYLQNSAPDGEQKDSITSEEITKYFKQAGFPLPKAIPQLLKDCKGAGYFDSADRGAYKLNPVGYNLVAHGLPRNGTSGLKSKASKKPAKKASSVKKTSKSTKRKAKK